MKPSEITLAQWAHDHDIKPRTAQAWAQAGLIKAKKQKLPVELHLVRLVETYVVSRDTKVPS